ncbi:MAG: hypothetical protein IIA41_15310, partial [SAR324 cluster bacterium]|nr:hypothetical protein [SAR324 cluster bacterium]
MLRNALPALTILFGAAVLLGGCLDDTANLKVRIDSPEGSQSIGVGDSLEFIANAKGGIAPRTLAWDFDSTETGGVSPTTGEGQEPGTVTFSSEGTYLVVVVVTDRDSTEEEASLEVTASYVDFVGDFTATSGDELVELSWTLPTHPDFQEVLIRGDTAVFPAIPMDGVNIVATTGTSHTDPSPTNGTEYFYSAFAFDADLNFGSGVTASATPADVTPSANVTGFSAADGGS